MKIDGEPQDVQEIKRVMEESRKKSNRNRLWIIVASTVVVLALSYGSHQPETVGQTNRRQFEFPPVYARASWLCVHRQGL
jgi:hypothetical protein